MTGEAIRCPHCSMGTAVEFDTLGAQYMHNRVNNPDTRYSIDYGHCQNPGCGLLIVRLKEGGGGRPSTARYVIPRSRAAMQFSDVPPGLVKDYEQANAVLDASPEASAALARRCLQRVIRDHIGVKEARLYDEIKAVADSGSVPRHLAEGLYRIREIGNLATHPAHDEQKGVIVDVSRDEAEWTLEVLEGLFKHCFVDPAEFGRRTQKLRDSLDRTDGQGEGTARRL
ncbi:MAG: DUF4145 domain-containing protein, partial [Thaumarchaeota archaeon S15]